MNPQWNLRVNQANGEFTFQVKTAIGTYYRVFPCNLKEIRYITTLEKNVEVLVPASGDGLFVRANRMPI